MPINPDAQTLLNMMSERTTPVHELTPVSAREQQRRRSLWANGPAEQLAKVYDRSVPGSAASRMSTPPRMRRPVLLELSV